MQATHNLALPYIIAAQAQKHVTHNEALRALDVLVQARVSDRDRTEPPAAPVEGAGHIVAPQATGAWQGRDGQLAFWQDGAWMFHSPQAGWRVHVTGEGRDVVYNGTLWDVPAGPDTLAINHLAINAGISDAHALVARGDATLLTNETADHRLVVNKAAPDDTASVVFQTAYAGHAELGLTGSNDFTLKVSADGSTFRDALVVDKATGAVSLPLTPSEELPPVSLRASGGGAQTVEPRSYTIVSDLVLQESDLHDSTFADGVLTIGPQSGGRFLCSASVVVNSTTASVAVSIMRNADNERLGHAQANGSGALYSSAAACAGVALYPGDVVSINVWHSHGSAIKVNRATTLSLTRIG